MLLAPVIYINRLPNDLLRSVKKKVIFSYSSIIENVTRHDLIKKY